MYVQCIGGVRRSKKALIESIDEDEFDTFIVKPLDETLTLNIFELMLMARNNQIPLDEFWTTPLHVMLHLLGLFQSPEKKPVSRKQLIEKEREMNRRWLQT